MASMEKYLNRCTLPCLMNIFLCVQELGEAEGEVS